MNRVLKITGIILILLAGNLSFAQEQITITTYYPSPFGSYRDLEAQRLAVGFVGVPAVFTNNYINVRTGYGDILSMGGNNVGADIDIAIAAPLARNMVSFTNTTLGRLANIDAANARCRRINYTAVSGFTQCPAGLNPAANFYAAQRSGTAPSSGWILCCRAD